MTQPRLSLILPMYNAAGTLRETLASLAAQEFDGLEVIAVDDGSSDASASVVEETWPSAKVIRQANAGPAAARNRGLEEASAPLITFLDADDLLPAGKLERQVRLLEESPDTLGVVGLIQKFRLKVSASPDSGDYEYAKPYLLFTLGCGVYRRELFDRVGGFDTTMEFGYSDDTDWILRAMEEDLPIHFEQDVALYYRIHPGGVTHGLDSKSNGFLLSVKKSLERRRRREEASKKLRQVSVPRDPSRVAKRES